MFVIIEFHLPAVGGVGVGVGPAVRLWAWSGHQGARYSALYRPRRVERADTARVLKDKRIQVSLYEYIVIIRFSTFCLEQISSLNGHNLRATVSRVPFSINIIHFIMEPSSGFCPWSGSLPFSTFAIVHGI